MGPMDTILEKVLNNYFTCGGSMLSRSRLFSYLHVCCILDVCLRQSIDLCEHLLLLVRHLLLLAWHLLLLILCARAWCTACPASSGLQPPDLQPPTSLAAAASSHKRTVVNRSRHKCLGPKESKELIFFWEALHLRDGITTITTLSHLLRMQNRVFQT